MGAIAGAGWIPEITMICIRDTKSQTRPLQINALHKQTEMMLNSGGRSGVRHSHRTPRRRQALTTCVTTNAASLHNDPFGSKPRSPDRASASGRSGVPGETGRFKCTGQFWSDKGFANLLAVDLRVRNDEFQYLWAA